MDNITDFIELKDLATFFGQTSVSGTVAEVLKRIWPAMPDGLNRVFIVLAAFTLNLVVRLARAPAWPATRLELVVVLMLSVVNGMVIAGITMKGIEFIAERKEREIATEMAAKGVQVTTKIVPAPPPAPDATVAPAPLATVATEVTPKRVDPLPQPVPKDSS